MSKRASSSPVSSPGGHSPDSMTPPPSKRIRPSDNGGALVPHEKTSDALVSTSEKVSSALILREGSRTSSLPNPEMILTGHEAAVYTLSFSPSGDYLASSGMDRNICKLLYYLL